MAKTGDAERDFLTQFPLTKYSFQCQQADHLLFIVGILPQTFLPYPKWISFPFLTNPFLRLFFSYGASNEIYLFNSTLHQKKNLIWTVHLLTLSSPSEYPMRDLTITFLSGACRRSWGSTCKTGYNCGRSKAWHHSVVFWITQQYSG